MQILSKRLFLEDPSLMKDHVHSTAACSRNLVPSFLNTVYSHDPAASLLNFDQRTLKFANPLSVFYTDDPSAELIDKIVQGSRQLTVEQVPEFVGLAANLLKTYKSRQTHNKDADAVSSPLKGFFALSMRIRFSCRKSKIFKNRSANSCKTPPNRTRRPSPLFSLPTLNWACTMIKCDV